MTEQEKKLEDQQALARLLTSVSAQLESYDNFMKMNAPQLAPDFNMISCLYPDENRLSNVIAMLLDPKGEHGQGDAFIQLFLNSIEKERPLIVNTLRQRLKEGRSQEHLK